MILNNPRSILLTSLPVHILRYYQQLKEDVQIAGISIAETEDGRGIYFIDFPTGTYDRWEWQFTGNVGGRNWFAWRMVEEGVMKEEVANA